MKGVLSAAAIGLLMTTSVFARDLDERERAMITDSVTSGLKEPYSAQIRFLDYNETTIFCGTVNAKNSYGGYVGFRPFFAIVELDEQKHIRSVKSSMLGDTPVNEMGVVGACTGNGYRVR